MVLSKFRKFIIASFILNKLKKQLITTSHGCLKASTIFAFGKIHFIKPNSMIDKGNLSIITFLLLLLGRFIKSKYFCTI